MMLSGLQDKLFIQKVDLCVFNSATDVEILTIRLGAMGEFEI
jgi:hypothetical protein